MNYGAWKAERTLIPVSRERSWRIVFNGTADMCTASHFSSHSARNYWTASLVWNNYQSFGISACFRRYWRNENAGLTGS